jgi:hypothetical protein
LYYFSKALEQLFLRLALSQCNGCQLNSPPYIMIWFRPRSTLCGAPLSIAQKRTQACRYLHHHGGANLVPTRHGTEFPYRTQE